MTTAPILPFAPDAFMSDTMHLTAEETGAYLMLLFCQWRNNGEPLKYDPSRLARMCRTTPRRFPKIWLEISCFFKHENGLIWQQRLLSDYQLVTQKILLNRLNGSTGGKAKSLKYNKPPLANAKQSLDPDCSERGSIPDTDTDIEKKKEESKIEGAGKPAPKTPSRKGCRINEKFQDGDQIPDNFLEAAIRKGLTEERARSEFRNMFEYYIGPDATNPIKKDWKQAFIVTWLRNSAKWSGNNNGDRNGQSGSSSASPLDAAREIIDGGFSL